LSAKGRAPGDTAKTADFFFLSNVYNQFLCSLTFTKKQFFSRKLEYLVVFNIPITWFCTKKLLLSCRLAQRSAWAVLLPSFKGLSDSCSTVAACAAVAQELSNITPNGVDSIAEFAS
jgi:hypothetical protein